MFKQGRHVEKNKGSLRDSWQKQKWRNKEIKNIGSRGVKVVGKEESKKKKREEKKRKGEGRPEKQSLEGVEELG